MKEFGLNLNSEQKRKNLSLDFVIIENFSYLCRMIEVIIQILGTAFVLLCTSCITWTIVEYIYLKFKNPRI